MWEVPCVSAAATASPLDGCRPRTPHMLSSLACAELASMHARAVQRVHTLCVCVCVCVWTMAWHLNYFSVPLAHMRTRTVHATL
ncbi:hypothetical protein EON66_06160 [archaeon]|nr:MAG: hypothetical protein EON66_06160 [archaeon]